MKKTQKLAMVGILIAVGVVCSPFSIPIGAAKCFPVQHMINVVAGVLLGPYYAVGAAFCTSLIRVMMGTGTLLSFPGSMVGALCCGMLYKYTGAMSMAYIGEVFGTGILGALAAYPVATLLMGRQAAVFAFVVPFMVSTSIGGAVSAVVMKALGRTKIFTKLQNI